MIEIKNKFTGKVIFKSKEKTIKKAIEFQVKKDAHLRGADLRGAYLRGADLTDADLTDAYLRGADLRGADLRVKVPSITSHQFISEILFRKSKTESQKDFSARIHMETNQCWKYFIKLAKKKRVLKWAMKILFQWKEFEEKFKEESND